MTTTKPWLVPAPTYRHTEAVWDTEEDAPGPRCAHTLTAVMATKSHGPRLILFGGATAIEGGGPLPGIRLAGVTNSVHMFDVLTKKWTRIQPAGEAPSPRAAHAAATVGTMVAFQGGIGPAGHSTDDLYVPDLSNDKYKWHRVVVQGAGPGPRYGHAMDLVAQRYLVTVSGNDVGVNLLEKFEKEIEDKELKIKGFVDMDFDFKKEIDDFSIKRTCNNCGLEETTSSRNIKMELA
ncbi:hypothetical protein HPP92_016257 [Vanilla planifolia]|uniref:Uncharacterized protein n=1 Tax=Vanilla planifolia TaxID=51239 RepID=A0A835QEF9_VANPL|nr:hypothetical protein HPP92_016257 [Vanilla planifolia]